MAKIILEIEAEQVNFGQQLPRNVYMCQPEVTWSASRELIYFTYAKLRPEHWLGVAKLTEKPDTEGGLAGWVGFTPKDGSPEYFRKQLPFAFWSVKSESSVTRDHKAVFLDVSDSTMMTLWHDYASAEKWLNPIQQYAEYREINGQYGRGYRPIYIADGDWILHEEVPEGHDNLGARKTIRVVSNADFEKMRAKDS